MLSHCFIFARGGSKGLEGKNIKELLGKPLIQYSIDVAKQVSGIDKIFVSTDDERIAYIAKNEGVDIIQRPAYLATDKAAEWEAWQHAVEWVTEKYGVFDEFISLPPTSPLRNVTDVESARNKLTASKADVCISITNSSRNPYFNMVENKGDFVRLLGADKGRVFRRQDAPDVYDITTVVYVTSPNFILDNDRIFDGKVTSVLIPKERAVDIDDIFDFKLAETILREHLYVER